jgi:hypothetical protein
MKLTIELMKRLSLYLFLILFTPQTPSLADDIRDFQIEGMSIGDSLLDFMTVDEIKQNTLPYFPDKRKYYIVGMFNNLKNFDQVEIYLKSNDKNYEIKTLLAALKGYNLNKCLTKKEEILKDIDKLFSGLEKLSDSKSHEADETGKSKQYIDQYNFDSKTHIRLECVKWTNKIKQEKGYQDTLNIVAMTKEIWNWIGSDYR